MAAFVGGHLAFRAAFDHRVLSSVCFFATDIHSATLGKGEKDDSLEKVKAGALTKETELLVRLRDLPRVVTIPGNLKSYITQMIFGKQDTHVPRDGRDLIRKTLEDSNVCFSVSETHNVCPYVQWA